ncbi:ThuA domain-containing protein [Luteolibacter pohnpeiensis]|uniref:ThuA domain-containing protein n=1 Tax=Luteolibacter pohnpeiensis TaxID=454153 RepID=A0A934S5E3_9BACT|nr:ThuA domain-containing protein [Luteolibacter pohnpeiensis]MBK1883420.1 ThuA domain-containing protein [Luteolibacter pohnpeiensis]
MKSSNHHHRFLAAGCALAFSLLSSMPAMSEDLPPDSIAPMGQKWAEKKAADTIRVLLVGSGSSHDFPKYFLKADSETLTKAGGMEVTATPNLEEALALLPEADVLVFSGNHDQWGTEKFQKALNQFADDGHGVIILHAGTWVHPWAGYNDRFVGGGSTGHGYGEFEVAVEKQKNPVMNGVPKTFKIVDESYRHTFSEDAKVIELAENHADGQKHACVWIVKDRKARIVDITLGHADEAHSNPAYQSILTNAVKWVAEGR